nr:T-complex protein 11-like protein 1 isoform X2 [Rhipicephalus microplus]
MKAANGMTKMALAHEIAMGGSFELKQREYPENSLEKVVKETFHKAFWDILEEQLNEDPPNYDQAMRLLQEAKEILLHLLMPHSKRLREEIEQVLDIELIRQQAEHGTLDFLAYARHVISLMARMCAPIRDASIKELLEIKEVVPLFRGIMEQLTLMKMDMANFSIKLARPLIQSHSVAYEQEQFKKYIEAQAAVNPSTDPLAHTKLWLRRSYEHLRNLSDQHSPDPINGPGCKGPGFASVLAGAYMELLSWPDDEPYPETLHLDGARYRALKNMVHLAALVASILSITYRLGGAALQGISDFKDDLKSHTQLLLDGSLDCSEEELRETLKNVASQVIKEVQECLQKHGFNQLQISQERVLYDQIVVMSSPDHHVRKLLLMRVLDFIKVAISSGSVRPTQIPPGLSALEKELTSITGQFLRLVTHNRAVFGEMYGDIVAELRK